MRFKIFMIFILSTSFGFIQNSNSATGSSGKMSSRKMEGKMKKTEDVKKESIKKMDSKKSEDKKMNEKKAEEEQSCNDFEKFKDVTMKEMKAIAQNGSSKILDVNSLNSFQKSHIRGAHHFKTLVAKKTLAGVLGSDKNVSIIAYCGGKQCTAWQEAAQTACQMGYKNIRHFSEGITGWDKMMKNKKG